ncbi:helix-turn-helix transcriptional regulator [Clostridium neonatale]|uniref:helix-turn-helix domain-containing protein n=1 Tax=Clostridium neonatale TaxID=137838 RepID=UPI00291B3981|nr:helix-turn-helix transcriptional regulator [Clostridium neonatale]CAI3569611.1 Helix-turn-helix transcriptional regulator [Clostridium neonatale]CAI3572779.1 Helix-turn-helix transcriptional regulator [Clostridium neonatale]CAI3593838.1 Helix-turn-helix transcriptional regulator [Clostridium neonatale]CAI3604701.1 Helix-turn-helix transcriptional regulator [Clostridium neonatale]CAI3607665.1 Helix-turn-helix transcriptional regulator [Clostridium neonatale]
MKATKVKLKRVEEGLKLDQVKELSGLSNTTLIKIEKGNIDNVQLGTLKKVAAALNSTVEELFLNE